MIKQAIGFALALLVMFGLSLLLVPAIAILIGVLNNLILNL